jgi:CheY-like chemotaxis protein
MDLQMPVMDGFAATKIIRNELGLNNLPIVAMTANAMVSDREACLAVGMNDHVGKPFDLNDLVRVLRRNAQWSDALAALVSAELNLAQSLVQAASVAEVDLNAALSRLGGKQDVYRRMLTIFLSDLQAMPVQLLGFAQNMAQGAASDDAKRLLHTLKGLAATLGAMALSNEAATAEKIMTASPSAKLVLTTAEQAGSAITKALPGLQALLAALQQDHPHATDRANAVAAHSLDRPALLAALEAMQRLLETSDMESMNTMAELQQQFGGAIGDEIAALEAAMADLDFDAALPLCKALLQKYCG